VPKAGPCGRDGGNPSHCSSSLRIPRPWRSDVLRLARHPALGADPAVPADRHHADITMNVKIDRPTNPPFAHATSHSPSGLARETQQDNDADRDTELAAQSRQVAGRPTEIAGLEAQRPNGLPVGVLPTEPCPASRDRSAGNRTEPRSISCHESQHAELAGAAPVPRQGRVPRRLRAAHPTLRIVSHQTRRRL
jgi:hypothetical protein